MDNHYKRKKGKEKRSYSINNFQISSDNSNSDFDKEVSKEEADNE